MSTRARALLIALFGPAIAVSGVLWVLVNVLIGTGRELTIRYVIFDSGYLVILAGIMVTAVSIPVALEVADAAPEDVELGLFQPEPAGQPSDLPADLPGRTWEAE